MKSSISVTSLHDSLIVHRKPPNMKICDNVYLFGETHKICPEKGLVVYRILRKGQHKCMSHSAFFTPGATKARTSEKEASARAIHAPSVFLNKLSFDNTD